VCARESVWTRAHACTHTHACMGACLSYRHRVWRSLQRCLHACSIRANAWPEPRKVIIRMQARARAASAHAPKDRYQRHCCGVEGVVVAAAGGPSSSCSLCCLNAGLERLHTRLKTQCVIA